VTVSGKEAVVDPAQPVSRVTPAERIRGDPTPGMVREQAIVVDGLWAGLVRTEARMGVGVASPRRLRHVDLEAIEDAAVLLTVAKR
jgi:hypothetical protein